MCLLCFLCVPLYELCQGHLLAVFLPTLFLFFPIAISLWQGYPLPLWFQKYVFTSRLFMALTQIQTVILKMCTMLLILWEFQACTWCILIIFTRPTSLCNSPQTYLCPFPTWSLLQASFSFPLSPICVAQILGCGTIRSKVDLTGTTFLKLPLSPCPADINCQ